MTDPAHPSSSPEVLSSIHWHQIWAMLLRRLWLFLLCFGTVVALTIVYIVQAPRIYLSSAAVQVEQQEQRIFKTPEESSGPAEDLRSDDAVKTIEQNLQNYSLFVDAVSDPSVANDPNFLVGYPSKDRPVPIPDEAKWLRANTQVSLRHGTRLIDVSVEHEVPEMAQKLVQALINAFLQENSRVQGSPSRPREVSRRPVRAGEAGPAAVGKLAADLSRRPAAQGPDRGPAPRARRAAPALSREASAAHPGQGAAGGPDANLRPGIQAGAGQFDERGGLLGGQRQ